MRLFVGVYPPSSVVDTLAAALRTVPRGDLRWVDPAQWHVTLRFLGDVDQSDPVAAALATVPPRLAATPGAVTAVLGPATAWLPGGHVLQVPVAGLDGLAALVAEVLDPLAPPADHPFHGHLTVARSPSRSRSRGRRPAVRPGPPPGAGGPGGGGPGADTAGAGVPVGASWVVEEMALMASALGSGPAVHRVVARVALP